MIAQIQIIYMKKMENFVALNNSNEININNRLGCSFSTQILKSIYLLQINVYTIMNKGSLNNLSILNFE